MYAPANASSLPPEVLQEFQYLSSKLKAWASVDHNEDGTHHVPALGNEVPIGAIAMWGAATAPEKWLLCDGGTLSRTDYQGLFNVIGTTYGAGDGSTTFNAPNLQQRFPLGKAASGTGATLGSTGGAIDHAHGFSGGTTGANGGFSTTTGSGGGGSTAFPSETGAVTVDNGTDTTINYAGANHVHTVSDHTHSVTVGDHTHSLGSGSTAASNPAYVVVQFIICAGV